MARRPRQKLFLAALVAGAALFAASSAPRGASATFVAPTPRSPSSASSSSPFSPPANLLDSASRALANATARKLELLVASLGQLSPPWLSQLVNEAARRKAGLARAEGAKVSSALGQPQPKTTTTTSPAALPYASPPPDAWLAADPCHAVPSPCAETAPFTLSEVRPARASAREGGGRLPAPAHLAPLTPTAPWSQVSGPGGSGPNPYWVTGQAATSVPGLSPGFEPDPAASMVLLVAGESALGRDTDREAESFAAAVAAAAAAPGRGGLVSPEAAVTEARTAGNITAASAAARSSTSARRLMAMKRARQMQQQQQLQQQQGRKRLLASLPPQQQPAASASASASSAGPPRASWSGAITEDSPRDPSSKNSRFSATPLVVDTEGGGYRFQVSAAASWTPALALYRGGAASLSPSDKRQLVAASSAPLAGKPNSAVLSVKESLKRGDVYTLVVTAAAAADSASADPPAVAADSSASAADSSASAAASAAAVGNFAALASGPGGVYPNATSIPPRWRVSSSTAAAAAQARAGGAKENSSASSAPSPFSTRGVLRRPEVDIGAAAGGETRDASAVVAFAALPFVLASSGRGFELRVEAGASATSKGRSWSPWAAVYELDAFEEALLKEKEAASAADASSSSSGTTPPPPLSTSGLVAQAVASRNSSTVALRGLSLEGAGKRYALVVGGRTPADGGEFVAEAFGPEPVKSFFPVATQPPPPTSPPSSSPPAPSPHLIEEAPAPSPPSSSSNLPRLLDPVSVDPPPPPPVRFAEYGIQNHGGPMMTGVPTLNFVFYSTPKFKPTTRQILVDLGKGLGESPWYRVQSSYMKKAGSSSEPMTPALRFGETTPTVDEGDPCWSGRALTDTSVGAVVTCLIKAGRLPYAANSLSLVLTGPDVAQGADATGSFCSNFCGWHSYTYDAQGRPFKFGFVGSAARCPSACAGQSAASPNGNVEADAMASIIAHEVTEAATDPELSAWFDGEGKENADKCAWQYGSVWQVGGNAGASKSGGKGGRAGSSSSSSSSAATATPDPVGGNANAKVGGREFLLQLNWANRATQGYCDNK